MHLTVNQIILLLQIHRGPDYEIIGTTNNDLEVLFKRGFIVRAKQISNGSIIRCPDGDLWLTTNKTYDLVRHIREFK